LKIGLYRSMGATKTRGATKTSSHARSLAL
jgi:hypothetical protein